MQTAAYWIEKLQLERHPEGGWFKEVYRSSEILEKSALPESFGSERNCSTSIYYLLEKNDFSAFHRIKSDEIWHFYTGTSAVEILYLIDGHLKTQKVGNNLDNEELFQFTVPKNTWFAAQLTNKTGYALVGCTVSPGFHFEDFELADESLGNNFTEYAQQINELIH
nr:cupin domain-containing protein [uncultured Draconibacterium sp.]